jgi:hypothetical protein
MPESWRWDMLYTIGFTRLQRMKFSCNKHWRLVDTELGLVLEIFYQVVSDEEQCREFLGLPISVDIGSPLTLSVAHRHHGAQMRTGWTEDPTDISDRDEVANNILIETQLSNHLKHDFAEDK